MKNFAFVFPFLFLIGAGCGSSTAETEAQARRAALIARTNELTAQPTAAPTPTVPASTEPHDGMYCWDKAPKLCHLISFSAGTVKLAPGGEVSDETFALTKNPSGKYSFAAPELGMTTFLTIKDSETLEVMTIITTAQGTTQGAPQIWKIK
jgi:hypothetical protein